MLPSITVHEERMARAATRELRSRDGRRGLSCARRASPFREAHEAVGEAGSLRRGSRAEDFGELSLEEYQRFSPQFEADVLAIDAQTAVAARDVYGGTAPGRCSTQLARRRGAVEGFAAQRSRRPDGHDGERRRRPRRPSRV